MSKSISKKTLNDLEFYTILDSIATNCTTDLGKAAVQKIEPIETAPELHFQLQLTNEYLASYQNENRIPNHYFDTISKEIHLLGIANSCLDAASFLDISTISETTNTLLKFFKKFKEYYPSLYEFSEAVEFTTSIIETIVKVINRYGEVVDKASPELKAIRKEMNGVRGQIGASFNKAMAGCISKGYLDEIKESVIDNQRVLAVQAMHRKKIKGAILGNSKTGSIVFIAPETTLKLSRELQNLEYDEQEEVLRILKALTDEIRPYITLLTEYQNYLEQIDLIAAKALYAVKINGLLPKIATEKKIFLRDAYHPILFEKNKEQQLTTIPQTLELNKEQQIIVISGPNAGGKSITLKTIGLLQVMIQSAILIPVHERSEVYFFDRILTDIGDNQSIENQLSTYSYRLKNMRNFLRKCNQNTLFLIDEFGTGSDPELGGALAEIFLEEFYKKDAYGIITTHYANLKVLADELEHVSNANMQFDERTLEPLFKLLIGQAGSSFTFEVAQKNGIPFSLINRAKKKVEGEKIRLDKTISKLQKERNKLQKTSESLQKEETNAKNHAANLSEKETKIKDKLARFQELYDEHQKMIFIGRKVNEISNHYFQTKNKKKLLSDFMKWVLIEKNKYDKTNPPIQKAKKEKKAEKVKKLKADQQMERVKKEVLAEVQKIRVVKKKDNEKRAQVKANYIFKVNDRVRLIDGKSVGTIEKLEKDNVIVNYGKFTTKTKTAQLELVEASKK